MVWFKVDDGLWAHPKFAALSDSAQALWLRAGAWCSQQLTDGHVPAHMGPMLRLTEEAAGELVRVGLWSREGDAYRFHDWQAYNPDAATVKAGQQAKLEGAARGNHKRWHTGRGVVVDGCEYCAEDNSDDRITDRSTDRISDSVATRTTDNGAIPPVPSRPVNNPPLFAEEGKEPDTDHFEEWWTHYPKKVDKGDARKAYTNALTKTTHQTLVDGAQGYAHFCENTNRERQYMKGPARWLNVEGWANEDELDTPKQQKPSKWDLPPEAYMHPEEVEDERRRAEQQQRNSGAR